MQFRLSLYLALSLVLIRAPMTYTNRCYYCDTVEVGSCLGNKIRCAEKHKCFTCLGLATLFPQIINNGCVPAFLCGKDHSLTFMGLFYRLTIYCFQGELCNTESGIYFHFPSRSRNIYDKASFHVSTATINTSAAVTVAIAILVISFLMALFLCWIL